MEGRRGELAIGSRTERRRESAPQNGLKTARGALEKGEVGVTAMAEASFGARLVFRGRVQGVGFRYSVCEWARRAGVSGWVRNRRDGTVEAELFGDERGVRQVITQIRSSFDRHLRSVSESPPLDPPPDDRGFSILPTI